MKNEWDKILNIHNTVRDDSAAEKAVWDETLFLDEIDCHDLYKGDTKREGILIFEVYG